jgi:hypothetical protein
MAEPMGHDAARDWIDEAFFTPGTREANDAAARAVRAHLTTCAECGVYDEATRRAALKLDMARGPSPEVKARTLAAARRIGKARMGAPAPVAARAPWGRGLTWRLAALVVIVAVTGAGAGAWFANSARQNPGADHLADAVVMMSALAAQSGTHEVVLHDAAGHGEGIAVMSATSHQLAIFATHLPAGPDYNCYLEHAGKRTWIGSMSVNAGVQFWAGDMDATIEMHPGDALIVAADESQPAVLTAAL